MKCFLFCAIASVLAAQNQPQPERYSCNPFSEDATTDLRTYDIVGMELRLYILSQSKPLSTKDVANLGKIAREAVLVLANAFSVNADQLKNCSLPDIEYYERERGSDRFITGLQETIDEKAFWESMDDAHWPLKNMPPFVGHLADNPALRGKKLPFHPAVESVLATYAHQERPVDVTDPVQVAARELLGQKQNWEIRKFKPIKLFDVNPNNILNDPRFFYQMEEFRDKSMSERLAILADMYR